MKSNGKIVPSIKQKMDSTSVRYEGKEGAYLVKTVKFGTEKQVFIRFLFQI